MHYLSIGCVFKNEGHALHEFIEHHLFHGVDHIFMINDFSTDNYLDIITPYIDNGTVTLFNNDIITKDTNRQEKIYTKYFMPLITITEWLALIDLDEFLYSPLDINCKNIVRKYENECEQITVEWKTFGSNQHDYQPFSIVSGFNKCCNYHESKDHYSYKSIIKMKNLIKFGIHSSVVNTGRTINLSYTTGKNELYINHYQLQSLDFFMNIKGKRGDCDNWYEHVGLIRDHDHFKKTDSNELEDNILIEQNRDIIRKVKCKKISMLENNDVTVVITSCNRPFLLEPTFDSFMKYNTYPIKEFIIIDDSGKMGVNDFIQKKYPELKITLLYNKTNIGQVKSIDIAYEYITTKYVFHCEEDWEFLRPGFIEASFEILKDDPNIFTVWLRAHNDGHPVDFSSKIKNYYHMKKDFSYMHQSILHTWCGVTFNPGLRRTIDILKYHPYTHYIQPDVLLNEVGEYVINAKYRDDGFYGAITNVKEGFCRHIGYNFHVPRKYD
jgi:hypothetical protein